MVGQRDPMFAGQFYPADRERCEQAVGELLAGVPRGSGVGAVVPHAGWIYSGACAALGIAGLADAKPETIVIFGTVHAPMRGEAGLYAKGTWQTPLGALAVDEELAARLGRCPHVLVDQAAHAQEHSIEVELPFIQYLTPGVKIVPVMVRPGRVAEEVGRCCAREVQGLGRRVAFVCSTDLTHYGPAYGFEPHGHGEAGIRWAKEVNDRRFIRLIEQLDGAGVVPEAEIHRNACGPGAVAAMIGAMLELGVRRYDELRHTTSAEVEVARGARPVNSVGYEAGVFVRLG